MKKYCSQTSSNAAFKKTVRRRWAYDQLYLCVPSDFSLKLLIFLKYVAFFETLYMVKYRFIIDHIDANSMSGGSKVSLEYSLVDLVLAEWWKPLTLGVLVVFLEH